MKFIHVSDVKLNESTPELFAGKINFSEERLKNFRAVIEDCAREKADFLLLTGNLFAGQPSKEDLQAVDEMLSVLVGTYIVIFPGEMDQAREDSPYRSYEWDSPVTVFLGDGLQRAYFEGADTEITGTGFLSETWSSIRPNLLEKGRKGTFQLLMLPLPGNEEEPQFPEGVTSASFDYIGIRSVFYYSSEGHGVIYGPGEFAPSGFTKQIRHGYYLGELTRKNHKENQLAIKFVPVGCCEFLTLRVVLKPEISINDVLRKVEETIQKNQSAAYYRVLFRGKTQAGMGRELEAGTARISRVLQVENLSEEEKPEEKDAGEEKALQGFLNRMNQVEEEDLRRQATEYGIRALQEAIRERKA